MNIEEFIKEEYDYIFSDLKAKENASITKNILLELLQNKNNSISVQDAFDILDDVRKILPKAITF